MTHNIIITDVLSAFTIQPITTSEASPLRYFLDEEHDAGVQSLLLFGRLLGYEELVALCGGDVGATELTVGISNTGLYLEYRHFSSDCVGACLIRRTEDMRLTLVNEHVRFLRRNGIERKKFHWFSRQKVACESLGITAIHVTGARTTIAQGYYYYPLFGFNASLPAEFARFLTQDFADCQTVLDLYEHPQGRKSWALYGCPCEMVFEQEGISNSSQHVYDQYLKQI